MGYIGNQPTDKALGPDDIENGAVAPANLSTGAPTWDTSGNLVAPGDITAFSDKALKTNVRDIDNALSLIKNLRGVRFTHIYSNQESIGVIAQEVREVVPELVKDNDNGYMSVAYGNIVAILIEAVKELSDKIEALESKDAN